MLAHKTYPGSYSCRRLYEELLEREIVNVEEVENLSPEKKKEILVAFSDGYTVPIGRGSNKIDINSWIHSELPENRWKGPCSEVLKNITISSEGFLQPCCGLVERRLSEFYFDDIINNDIFEVFSRANNSVLYNWLALEGPSGIMDYIKSQNKDIPFNGRYVQNCQLCQEIFTDEKKKEVLRNGLQATGQQLGIKRMLLETDRQIAFEKSTRCNN